MISGMHGRSKDATSSSWPYYQEQELLVTSNKGITTRSKDATKQLLASLPVTRSFQEQRAPLLYWVLDFWDSWQVFRFKIFGDNEVVLIGVDKDFSIQPRDGKQAFRPQRLIPTQTKSFANGTATKTMALVGSSTESLLTFPIPNAWVHIIEPGCA